MSRAVIWPVVAVVGVAFTCLALAQEEPTPKKAPTKKAAPKKAAPKTAPPADEEPGLQFEPLPGDEPPAKQPGKKSTKKSPKSKPQPPADDEEAAPAKDSKKKAPGRTEPGKKKKLGKEKLPDFEVPEGVCRTCCGTGHIPLRARTPYFHIEGQPVPSAAAAVPWRWCPTCSGDHDAEELVEMEKERLKDMMRTNLLWEKRAQMKFVRVESRHFTIHCDSMPPEMVQKQGQAAEATIQYIQQQSGTVFLTPTRPQTADLVFPWDDAKYKHMIQVCQQLDEFKGVSDWNLVAQCAGFSGGQTRISNAGQGKPTPPEHKTISEVALRQMTTATAGKAKDWLDLGFAYHCESAVTTKVLVHYIDYQVNDNRLGGDWAAETRKYLQMGKLKKWNDLFNWPLKDWTPGDHLSSYAAVSYLFRTNPKGFVRMVMLIRNGTEDAEAMETAFGKKIAELEKAAARWIATGK